MTQTSETAQTTLRIARTFAAPREAVFRAWTDPEALSQWFHAGDDYRAGASEVDLRVGGKYRMGMTHIEKGTTHVAIGEFKEIEPPSRLVMTWSWEENSCGSDPENLIGAETLLTLEFNDHDGGTELVLTHERFPTEAMRDDHAGGWNACLVELGKLVVG